MIPADDSGALMRLPLLVLLAACGGKDSDIFPVDTGAAPTRPTPAAMGPW
jgi:hypothetical protein